MEQLCRKRLIDLVEQTRKSEYGAVLSPTKPVVTERAVVMLVQIPENILRLKT